MHPPFLFLWFPYGLSKQRRRRDKCPWIQMPSVGQKPKHCVVPQWSLFDEYSACDDKSDLCASNSSKCTRCVFSNLTISQKQVCDGIIDCPDLSDECLCSSLLPLSNRSRQLCDRIRYGTPNVACEKCEQAEFICDENPLGISKVCDGFADCPKSQLDEAFCSASSNEAKRSEEVNDFLCDKIRDDVKAAAAKFLSQTTVNDLLPTKATRYDFHIFISLSLNWFTSIQLFSRNTLCLNI